MFCPPHPNTPQYPREGRGVITSTLHRAQATAQTGGGPIFLGGGLLFPKGKCHNFSKSDIPLDPWAHGPVKSGGIRGGGGIGPPRPLEDPFWSWEPFTTAIGFVGVSFTPLAQKSLPPLVLLIAVFQIAPINVIFSCACGQVTVKRDGQTARCDISEVVVGDILTVQYGDILGADGIYVTGKHGWQHKLC